LGKRYLFSPNWIKAAEFIKLEAIEDLAVEIEKKEDSLDGPGPILELKSDPLVLCRRQI